MAWTNLPTDYKDASWSGLKRYNQIDNEDGTVSFQDVTVYTDKEKSFFGAKDANAMNKGMNDIVTMFEDFATAKVLWTNPEPTTAYGGQTVTIPNLAEYDHVIIVYANYTLGGQASSIFRIAANSGGTLGGFLRGGNGTYTITSRTASINTSVNGVVFGNAYNAAGTFTSSMNNSVCIPYEIIGVKIAG